MTASRSITGYDVAVVIPTYRRPDGLTRLLKALGSQAADIPWEIIVVDDCSGPEVQETLAALKSFANVPVRVLSTPVNSGPAVARNIGWRASNAPLVAFLDDDVVPAPDWLIGGLRALRADHTLGVVQGRTEAPEGVDLHCLPLWSAWRDVLEAGPYFEGCNIFYRRDALEVAGGFDEGIGWWGEDTALAWRVIETGWSRSFAPTAVVVHDVEWRGPRWYVEMAWKERNLILLAARHPGFRAEAFWRPWAYRRRDAAFVLAVASGLLALRWRSAAIGVAPYLWLGRPSIREPQFLQHCVETLAVDAVRSAAHIVGALEQRVAVL